MDWHAYPGVGWWTARSIPEAAVVNIVWLLLIDPAARDIDTVVLVHGEGQGHEES